MTDIPRVFHDLLLGGQDPFRDHSVRDVWLSDPPDIASLNADARRAIVRVVDEVASDGLSRGVLLVGGAGFGKTHTVSRLLRADLHRHTLYVYINHYVSPDKLYRHILRQVTVNLRRRRPGSSRSQLEEMLDRVALVHGVSPLSDADDEKTIRRRVAEAADRLTLEDPDLDRAFLRVILRARVPRLALTVADWLAGRDLDEEDLALIGVPAGRPRDDLFGANALLAQESSAFEALKNLARLARLSGPVVLVFDQTESVTQHDEPGRPAAKALISRICSIHDAIPNVAILFTAVDEVWARFEQQILASEQARIAACRVDLRPLTPDEAEELVALRLKRLYGDHRPPYPTYPFERTFIRQASTLTPPRDLLKLCSDLLSRMRARASVEEVASASAAGTAGSAPAAPNVATPAACAGDAERIWERFRAIQEEIRATADPRFLDEEEVPDLLLRLLDGLAGETLVPGVKLVGVSRHDAPPPIVCRVETPAGPTRVGVALGEARGTQFAALTRRLLDAVEGSVADRIVLVREGDVKESWKKGTESLLRLLEQGGRWVRLDVESKVGLGALRDLLAGAQDLEIGGRPADPTEIVRLLRDRLVESIPVVWEILAAAGAPAGEPARGDAIAAGRAGAV